jgi:hypothetical protein
MSNGGVVIWPSKEHEVADLSTIEAEYAEFSRVGQSIVHFMQLIHDIRQKQRGTATVYEYNEEAVELANNPMASNTTKHIDIKHHWIREMVDAKTIAVRRHGVGRWNDEGPTRAEAHHNLHAMHGSGAGWGIALFTLLPMRGYYSKSVHVDVCSRL